jgi:hypothetical protein
LAAYAQIVQLGLQSINEFAIAWRSGALRAWPVMHREIAAHTVEPPRGEAEVSSSAENE